MTLSSKEAREIVLTAMSRGITYDTCSIVSSTPEQFGRVFREFDEGIASGNELRTCWLLNKRYRPPCFNNELIEATTVFANDNLNAFVSLVDEVQDSNLLYELTFFPLLNCSPERCCAWITTARSKRLVALGIVAALRDKFTMNADLTDEWIALLDNLSSALRTKSPIERARMWWQIIALSRNSVATSTWTDLSRVIWLRAATEVDSAASHVQEYVLLSEPWIEYCPALRALLVAIAENGDAASREAARAAILVDFERRLMSEQWNLPKLNDRMESVAYLPACGWAIAQDIMAKESDPWWIRALTSYLPHFPRWHGSRDDPEKCALILVAACDALELLRRAGRDHASKTMDEIANFAERWLPHWLWDHSSSDSAVRVLPAVLISCLLSVGNSATNARRILQIAMEIRSHRLLDHIVTTVERAGALDALALQKLKETCDARGKYEAQLNGPTTDAVQNHVNTTLRRLS